MGMAGGTAIRADGSGAPAYYVAEVDVHDLEAYKTKYVPYVAATLAPFGGHYLAAGGRSEAVEGSPPAKRIAILQFPSVDKARDWYNSAEYGKLKAVRHAVAATRSFIVEGRPPPKP